MTKEKVYSPVSGYIMVTIAIILFALAIWGFTALDSEEFALLIVFCLALCPGFFFVNPNNSVVLILFGEYKGTVKENGFFWVNPFYMKKSISLRARNFDSDKIKVNDKVGNPIQIGVILVWQVKDTFKASFDVDNYETFVKLQTDSAVRRLTGLYPYDNFDTDAEITLRSGNEEVNHALEENLSHRLD